MKRLVRVRWLVAMGVALTLVAAACGDDDDDDAASSSTPQAVKLQLDWTPNTNHTGFFVADALGYYAEAGLDLEILPYSGGNADEIVASGQADFGVSFHNSITLAGPAGVPIVAVAAILQRTAEAIAVKADRDEIASPKDLDGLTYAGFGGPQEVPVLQAIIRADGGTGEFEAVALNTSAYEAVYSGAADFTIPFILWEGIEAELNGEPVKYFEYSDYGLPNQYSVMLVTSQDHVANDPELVRTFLAASQKGWDYAISNPQEAAQILIDANPGVFTNEELVFRSAQEMADGGFLTGPDGHWGTFDPAVFAGYSNFLFEAGIVNGEDGNPLTTAPDWNLYLNNTLLPAN